MKRGTKFVWGSGGVAAVAVLGVSVLLPVQGTGSHEPCCFANQRYDGVCTVVPGEGETCDSILAYLNDPMSSGKTYCGNSQIRGGWSRVDCTAGKSGIRGAAKAPATRTTGSSAHGVEGGTR